MRTSKSTIARPPTAWGARAELAEHPHTGSVCGQGDRALRSVQITTVMAHMIVADVGADPDLNRIVLTGAK